MKLLSLITLLAFSTYTKAITFEVIGPCEETPIYTGEMEINDLKKSIGQLSVELFQKYNVPFIGNDVGMNSILNTPTGLDAMEVLSDETMRSHGWCYSVDGEIPEVLANEVWPNTKKTHIKWFFGYSYYDRGEWYGYCELTNQLKPKQFCK